MSKLADAVTEVILANIDEGQKSPEGEGLADIVRFFASEDNWDDETREMVLQSNYDPEAIAREVARNLIPHIANALDAALDTSPLPQPEEDVSDLEE